MITSEKPANQISNNIQYQKTNGAYQQPHSIHKVPSNIDFDAVYKPSHDNYTGAKSQKSSLKSASMTLLKAYIGSGLLALPYAFMQGGWFLSLVVFSISCIIVIKCVNLLLEVAGAYEQENIGLTKLMEIVYGKVGLIVTRTFLITYQIGKSIAYLIFFIQFFAHVMSEARHQETGEFIYLILALAIVIPMGFIDNIAKFAKFSIFANILTQICVLAIIIYTIILLSTEDIFIENASNIANFGQIFMVLGVSIYGFGVMPMLFPIRNSIQNINEFPRLFKIVTLLVLIVFYSFTLLCVWGFGNNTKQIILFSLGDSALASIIQIFYAIALIFSYPLALLPAFQQLEEISFIKQYIDPELKFSRFRRLLSRVIVNIIVGLIAYGVPQFAYFINILGSIGGASLTILMPLCLHYSVFKGKENEQKKYIYILILAFGIFGGLSSFIYSIVKLAQGV